MGYNWIKKIKWNNKLYTIFCNFLLTPPYMWYKIKLKDKKKETGVIIVNNQVYYEVSNKSLGLTYQILDVLIAVVFFILIFGLIYKGLAFIVKTIGLILSTILNAIIPEKEDCDSDEDDLRENVRTSRSACYAKNDNNKQMDDVAFRNQTSKKPDKTTLQIESVRKKTFDDLMNNK